MSDTAGRIATPAWLFLVAAAATLCAHVVAAGRAGSVTATSARAASPSRPPWPADLRHGRSDPPDRFAALQPAVVRTLLPVGGAPIVDPTRVACLAVGAVTALRTGGASTTPPAGNAAGSERAGRPAAVPATGR